MYVVSIEKLLRWPMDAWKERGPGNLLLRKVQYMYVKLMLNFIYFNTVVWGFCTIWFCCSNIDKLYTHSCRSDGSESMQICYCCHIYLLHTRTVDSPFDMKESKGTVYACSMCVRITETRQSICGCYQMLVQCKYIHSC